MFRKPLADFNAKAIAPLRASDLEKLKKTVADTFSIPQEVVDLIVPDGLFSVRFKSHSHVPGVAYLTSESVPLWFTSGKHSNDTIPTVYTLWKYPDLLPIISIPGEKVPTMHHAEFLLDSNITFQSSASISAGQFVCVTQDYEPTADGTPRIGPALAVGRMTLPSHLVEGGAKGKVLTLLHAWKDQLWEMGGVEKSPRPRLFQGSPSGEEDTDEESADEETEGTTGIRPKISGDSDTPKELSREEVSDGLRSALLQSITAVLSKLPPGSFPITPSIFHETYILPYRSSQLTAATSTPVDIKHSGFKSLSAFLKASAKEGLIKIKGMKEEVVVTGVNGLHPSVLAHVHHVAGKDVETQKEKEEEQRRMRQVTFLRKPGPVNTTFFQRVGKDPEDLFTEEEIKTTVNLYLTSKRLFKPHDPKFVNLARDRFLLDTVLDGREDDRAELLETKFMSTDEVVRRIVNGTKTWYKISAGDRQPIIGEGKPAPISVDITHSNYRTVTCVSGFENFHLNADSLAEGLKTAPPATVEPDSREPELKQITVQGNHAKVVIESLIARGIQSQWIKVVNHTEVKKHRTKKRKPKRKPT